MLMSYHRYMCHRMKLLHDPDRQPLINNQPHNRYHRNGKETDRCANLLSWPAVKLKPPSNIQCPAPTQTQHHPCCLVLTQSQPKAMEPTSVRVALAGSMGPHAPGARFLRVLRPGHSSNQNPTCLLRRDFTHRLPVPTANPCLTLVRRTTF